MNRSKSNSLSRDYYGNRPCIPPVAMMELQRKLRPKEILGDFFWVNPPTDKLREDGFFSAILTLTPEK